MGDYDNLLESRCSELESLNESLIEERRLIDSHLDYMNGDKNVTSFRYLLEYSLENRESKCKMQVSFDKRWVEFSASIIFKACYSIGNVMNILPQYFRKILIVDINKQIHITHNDNFHELGLRYGDIFSHIDRLDFVEFTKGLSVSEIEEYDCVVFYGFYFEDLDDLMGRSRFYTSKLRDTIIFLGGTSL